MKVNDLLNIAFEVSELNRDLALSKSRQKDYVKIRQLILFFAFHEFDNYSLTTVGNILGKDHATVLYSIEQVKLLDFQKWQPYLRWRNEIQNRIDLFYEKRKVKKFYNY